MVSPLSEAMTSWETMIAQHPDRQFAAVILRGLQEGFRVGFEYQKWGRLKQAKHNMRSCEELPAVVEGYLEKECRLGHTVGPLDISELSIAHISPFGVIPKKGEGKWRLIVNLSFPEGHSVNDFIPEAPSSVSYVTVDMIADRIAELGQGTMMAKLDVKSAFRIIPVSPQDRILLGMKWEGKLYVDRVLPFGLRSAPRIFSAVADAIQFGAITRGVKNITHYLDDFVILGSPGSDQCRRDLMIMTELCAELGVPLAGEKQEGPAQRLVILGIQFDTGTMQMSLPLDKVIELRELLEQWRGDKVKSLKEIESLAGHLQFAAKVVRPGRCFVRQIYQLSKLARRPEHLVRLNKEVRSDLSWWRIFMKDWNGLSLFWKSRRSHPDVTVWSDASGSWGCGALTEREWLQYQWTSDAGIRRYSIAVLELVPIVLSGVGSGQERWSGSHATRVWSPF